MNKTIAISMNTRKKSQIRKKIQNWPSYQWNSRSFNYKNLFVLLPFKCLNFFIIQNDPYQVSFFFHSLENTCSTRISKKVHHICFYLSVLFYHSKINSSAILCWLLASKENRTFVYMCIIKLHHNASKSKAYRALKNKKQK